MMAPARPSFWVDVANACRGYDGTLGLIMLATAFSLALMMAIGILVTWQIG
jgi:hypothetical protein